jgi:hypothetical protein
MVNPPPGRFTDLVAPARTGTPNERRWRLRGSSARGSRPAGRCLSRRSRTADSQRDVLQAVAGHLPRTADTAGSAGLALAAAALTLIDAGWACPVGSHGAGERPVGAVALSLIKALLPLGALSGLKPVDGLPGGAARLPLPGSRRRGFGTQCPLGVGHAVPLSVGAEQGGGLPPGPPAAHALGWLAQLGRLRQPPHPIDNGSPVCILENHC